jgi:poly(A) polymerase
MSETFRFERALPANAEGALRIVRRLAEVGHEALLAGGCVRDLLLGQQPEDYDVATDALPERICALFRSTRRVGAQFGVVLVKQRGRWVEVATFRTDGDYLDGRHPVHVEPTDARHDALRRDFTVNGMFLDPSSMEVIDYVGGRRDLGARVIRAIGDPAQRFDEDYLRLVRAVRFAARLDFPIEPQTLAAIRSHAPTLARVAAERVREELARMLSAPSRARAWQLLGECGLLPYLWPGAGWSDAQAERVAQLLARLPDEAPFELALAIMLADASADGLGEVVRGLALSNEEHGRARWLVTHQADLDDPAGPTLVAFKRLMAHPAFAALCMWARARYEDLADGAERRAALARRRASIPAALVQPPPWITGGDLMARGLPPGPAYTRILDGLYERQLAEELTSREQALAALDEMLKETEG